MTTIRRALANRVTYVWALLVVLTVASWVLAATRSRHGHVSASTPETVAVLIIAAVKARFVLRDFMEVRTAPRWLRRFADLWVAILTATLLVMYLA